MWKKLLLTDDSVTGLILRLTLGLVMFPHGAQKFLGVYGGYGFSGTMGYLTGQVGLPTVIAFLVIMAEFFGSLGLILGLGTRIAAFGILCVMTGAVLVAHLPNGFFMNWAGNQAGEGFEYHLLAIGIALALILKGAGKASIDRMLVKKKGAR